ncbi:NADH-quinone oxidoreductase subunit K [Marivirga sp. S37H4]|uniref:NADH-quinone oxidoreductase subunit K n=1 Tax=Marivirga aurantiaca TaxID=2802615 RepID=A0A934WXI0_9BACT|nr:NADH-quinone oxidoreductase subunit K [Marivirga aurantiaca]MBK6264963.1 NADH-quinone oxidoreductase subunit K [Marivirga aurantiaca]
MEFLLSILTGLLFAAGVYLLLHRDFAKLVMGIVIIGNATAIFIFVAGRIVRKSAPFLDEQGVAPDTFADPVPQALILTALVIGFGIQAFALLLFKKVYDIPDIEEVDDLKK